MAASAAASAAAGRTSQSVGHLQYYPQQQHHHHDPRRMVAATGGGQTRLKPSRAGGQQQQQQQQRGSGVHGHRGGPVAYHAGGPVTGSSSRTRSGGGSGRQVPSSAPPPPPPVHATSSRGYSHRYVTGVDYYSDEDAGGCCCLSSLCRHCDFIQVIAFICGLIVVLLMILCLASSNWLTADHFRQGLWEQCIDDKAPQPLPFNLEVKKGGCYPVRAVGYIQAAAVLCVLTLLCDIGATVMTGCGLCSKDPQRKYLLYRIALYVMVCALLCILVALVIYPACFAAEIEQSNRQLWEFGWAYGVGWGAAIFLFGAILLLLCDKETEEIYYKERAITHHHGNESKA